MSEDNDKVQQQSKNKTVVFTIEERKLLLKLVNMHFDVLNNGKTDNASIQLKNQAWESIHKKYIENTGIVQLPRTPQQLRRCWENMRARVKKGNPMCVKLLRWAEIQHKMMLNGKNNNNNGSSTQEEIVFESMPTSVSQKNSNDKGMALESPPPLEVPEEDSTFKNIDGTDCSRYQTKLGDAKVQSNKIMNSFLNSIKLLESSNCVHCSCEKAEKNARIHLLALQQQQNEELHQLQLQMAREKMKHEKELQKLYIHEMTLKIENERRRAEILDRELNN